MEEKYEVVHCTTEEEWNFVLSKFTKNSIPNWKHCKARNVVVNGAVGKGF